jgi:tRNA 2-selenouridine synthase
VFPEGGKQSAFQLLDVRAPVEVHRSGIPGALSLPILNDEEREAVGTCYHEHGQAAAVALGVELTAPHREARVAAWREAVARSDRPAAFACWRGGKRSALATEWLSDSNVSRVQGGTKALRRYLMASLESQFARTETLAISGLTGCGKTDLLHAVRKACPRTYWPSTSKPWPIIAAARLVGFRPDNLGSRRSRTTWPRRFISRRRA